MDLSKLKRYRQLKSDIEALGEQIEGLYNTYRSPNLNRVGSAGRNYIGSPVSEAVNYITTLQETFTAEYEEMVQLGQEIETWLQSIQEPDIVAIIRCYYLCGMSWEETTDEVMGTYYTWSASRVKLRRYLQKRDREEQNGNASD